MSPAARWRLALAPLLAALAAVVLLRCLDAPPRLPPCPSLTRFGIPCAGCGGTRMVLSLSRGDFASAWRLNALWTAVLPPLLLGGYWALLHVLWPRRIPASPLQRHPLALAVLLAAAVLAVTLWRARHGPQPAPARWPPAEAKNARARPAPIGTR